MVKVRGRLLVAEFVHSSQCNESVVFHTSQCNESFVFHILRVMKIYCVLITISAGSLIIKVHPVCQLNN